MLPEEETDEEELDDEELELESVNTWNAGRVHEASAEEKPRGKLVPMTQIKVAGNQTINDVISLSIVGIDDVIKQITSTEYSDPRAEDAISTISIKFMEFRKEIMKLRKQMSESVIDSEEIEIVEAAKTGKEVDPKLLSTYISGEVRVVNGALEVTGSDKAEVRAMISAGISKMSKANPGVGTGFAWRHLPGPDSYKVILSIPD